MTAMHRLSLPATTDSEGLQQRSHIQLSAATVAALQRQLAFCTSQLSIISSSCSGSSLPTEQQRQRFIANASPLLTNIQTFYAEYNAAAVSCPLPFTDVVGRLLPTLPSFLFHCLNTRFVLDSQLLPPLLRCLNTLFPLSAPSASQLPQSALSVMTALSAESLDSFLSSLLTSSLAAPCISLSAIRSSLSSLSSSSLLLLAMRVEAMMEEEAADDALLVAVLHCAHQLLTASSSVVACSCSRLSPASSHSFSLSALLSVPPSLSLLPDIIPLLSVSASSSASAVSASFVLLSHHKQWADYALFSLLLPSLFSAPQLSAWDRQQLLLLLSHALCSAPSSSEREELRQWLGSALALLSSCGSLSALTSLLAASELSASSPSSSLLLLLLLGCVPLFPPSKEETSAFISALLAALPGMPAFTLPRLLYALLSVIECFLSSLPLSAAACQPSALRSACCEAWGHALTCPESVPALKADAAHRAAVRRSTKQLLAELRRLKDESSC